MMVLLLIAGIGFLLAGVLTIGFGIPVKEFSFGKTLILTGTVAACTGLIMLGPLDGRSRAQDYCAAAWPGGRDRGRGSPRSALTSRLRKSASNAEPSAPSAIVAGGRRVA
jgi:hypothetical protein